MPYFFHGGRDLANISVRIGLVLMLLTASSASQAQQSMPNMIGSASVPAYQLGAAPNVVKSRDFSMKCRPQGTGSGYTVCEDDSIAFPKSEPSSTAQLKDQLPLSKPADGQTLAETVAYIVTGGFVAPGDMKVIGDEIVETPQYITGLFTLMSANRIRVSDKNSCTIKVETNPEISQGIRELSLQLNNVVLADTVYRLGGSSSQITLRGDHNVICVSGVRTGCFREYAINVRPENSRRVQNAISYLYENFCTSSVHKGRF